MIDHLLKHLSIEFDALNIRYEMLEEIKKYTNDRDYFSLLGEKTNGGYFYNNSLHLYGCCDLPKEHNILVVNEIIHREYGEISRGLFCFGQDLFGNQFAFSERGIEFFNIETGQRELLAKTFIEWIETLIDDLDYLTGRNFINDFNDIYLLKDHRFSPKKPFVIGGEYEMENFYLQIFPEYILTNANIARQVYNLPDGTKIKISTSE